MRCYKIINRGKFAPGKIFGGLHGTEPKGHKRRCQGRRQTLLAFLRGQSRSHLQKVEGVGAEPGDCDRTPGSLRTPL